tara:strand:+ start:1602 stop:3023 length:1422 start_codon:yes stop_codon:yes gene_type:complete
MSEAEKKRLRQHILQSRASNIVMIDPTTKSQFQRFEPQNIDRLRLFESQLLAGKVPVSEKLKKEQKKKKKKAKRGKQLRGDLARNLREQRRSEKGERRDNDTEEPRIVGDPVPGEPQTINVNIPGLAEAIKGLAELPQRRQGESGARIPGQLALRARELAARRERPGRLARGPIIAMDRPRPLQARADADPIPEILRLEPVLTPSPGSRFEEILEPREPEIAIISGGGELNLPNIVVGTERSIEGVGSQEARLRLVDTQDFLAGFDRPAQRQGETGEISEGIRQEQAQASPPQRPLRPQDEAAGEGDFLDPDEVGLVQETGAQNIEKSKRTFRASFDTMSADIRPGPTGERGTKRGKGYRVRNNTDRKYKKIEPGDVVNVIGSQAGNTGEGVYILDTGSAKGSQVSLPSFEPLIDDGSLIFEKGHRHELGGHFKEQPYGPPPVLEADQLKEELQGGATGQEEQPIREGEEEED